MRSGANEKIIQLNPPSKRDVRDYDCPSEPQTVRLVRQVTPDGKIRVLMTKLFDQHQISASLFADLYHQRWRIGEAFKRLKHQLNLEHVSGLSQHAVAQDVAAKILCENMTALASLAAHAKAS